MPTKNMVMTEMAIVVKPVPEQELKQKNVGSGESTNDNCGTNSIDGGLALAICGEIEIGADGDGVTSSDPGAERTSSHDDW